MRDQNTCNLLPLPSPTLTYYYYFAMEGGTYYPYTALPQGTASGKTQIANRR